MVISENHRKTTLLKILEQNKITTQKKDHSKPRFSVVRVNTETLISSSYSYIIGTVSNSISEIRE